MNTYCNFQYYANLHFVSIQIFNLKNIEIDMYQHAFKIFVIDLVQIFLFIVTFIQRSIYTRKIQVIQLNIHIIIRLR